jgi:hypothetical protein
MRPTQVAAGALRLAKLGTKPSNRCPILANPVRVPRAGGINAQDLAAMSRQSGGEVALYRNASNGERCIAIGNKTGVNIPENSRLIAHTQPGTGAAAVRASVADEAALVRLNQRSSVIINDAGDAATRFRQTAKGSELARAEAGDVRLHAPDVKAQVAKETKAIPNTAAATEVSSPIIDASELTGKTRTEIRDLATSKGLLPKGDQLHPDFPRRFNDPITDEPRIRLDRGHVDPQTGLPYNNPNAAADHVHGYDLNGDPIKVNGDKHIPTVGE